MSAYSDLVSTIINRDTGKRRMSPASIDNLTQSAHSVSCKCKCPGGEPCCLNGDRPHSLHVCRDRECLCHSPERYEGKL